MEKRRILTVFADSTGCMVGEAVIGTSSDPAGLYMGHINGAECIRCGACKAACPAGAIRLESFRAL